jgi:Ca2+-binding RTX toxin-like protein
MASDKELVIMSQQAYFADGGQPPDDWVFVVDSDDLGIGLGSGYYGAVYRNTQTNEIVFAHRGTEFTQGNDVEGLLQAALNAGLSQFVDAEVFYNLVKADADFFAGAFPGLVFQTGHSLGGGIAALMGARTGETTVGFNSIGVKGVMTQYGLDPNGSYGNVRNISAFYDPAKTVGEKIGTTQNVFVSSFAWVPDLFEPVVVFLGFKVVPALGIIGAKYFTFSQHAIANLVETVSALENVTEDIQLTPIQESDFDDLAAAFSEISGLDAQVARTLFASGPALDAAQIQVELTTDESTVRIYVAGDGNDLVLGGDSADQLSGSEGNDLLFGDAGDDQIDGGMGQDILVGGAGHDTIQGGDGDDILIGRDGNDQLMGESGRDTLQGGEGDDTLVGGDGLDTYILRAGGGVDHIADSGANRIIFRDLNDADVELASFLLFKDAADPSMGRNATGTITFTLNSPLTLTETTTATQVVIENFVDGDFGITLRDAQTAHTDETVTFTLAGDLEPVDFDPDTSGTQTQRDERGNVIVTGNPESDRADTLFGDISADDIDGLGGNDTIWARAGDDDVDGGDGDDVLHGEAGFDYMVGGAGADALYGEGDDDELLGGAGDDVLEGGAGYDRLAGEAGRDLLAGQEGDDELYAANLISLADLPAALAAGETQMGSGLAGDLLDGGTGNDIALGAEGDDAVSGASGADVLAGGGGADNVLGDWELLFAGTAWTANRVVTTDANGTTYTLDFTGASYTVAAVGGNDELYGGAGDDWLFANGGDDYLDGGADNDVLFGQEGFDVLFGGGGDDVVVGDDGALPAAQHGDDYLDGEEGNDTLYGGGGADELFGGSGNDKLFGDDASVDIAYQGADYLDGEDGDDELYGYGGNDDLFGGAGVDTLSGGDGDDYLDGEGDNDEIYAGNGNDIAFGGDGADLLVGDLNTGGGDDYLDGEDGNDTISGGGGADILNGGSGDDFLFGDADDVAVAEHGDDVLSGGLGADYLRGYGGDDSLSGDEDNDTLQGEAGSDVLSGGTGDDQLVGGAGLDTLDGGDGDDQLFGDASDVVAADHGADVMRGGLGNDFLRGYGGNDQLFGDDGADTMFGEAGADYLEGGSGDDFLYGDSDTTSLAEQGNDTLDGGAGNDQLVGYAGNDVYIFGRGYGQDVVFDQDTTAGNIDAVQFAADITPDDVTASRPSGSIDLVLAINGATDTLTIKNHFFSAEHKIEEIRFADGTVWTSTTIPLLIRGTTGNDNLLGTSSPEIFEGLTGNDTLQGSSGGDQYRIFRGDGVDLIIDSSSPVGSVDKLVYAPDILPSDIVVSRSGNNLVLRLTGTADQVTISNYLQNDGQTSSLVEQIKFLSDGTIWDISTVRSLLLFPTDADDSIIGYASDDYLYGLAGRDSLWGNGGNDTLEGGIGDDTLRGGTGNDLYLFSRGEGSDVIIDSSADVDTLRFAADILPADITIRRYFDDLILTVISTTDEIRLADSFNSGLGDDTRLGIIERFEFIADGTVWTSGEVAQWLLIGGSGDDVLTGYATDDFINGNAGNDILRGHGGNDTLVGGLGNDQLEGDKGNDIYRFSRGDGQDRAFETDTTAGNLDTIELGIDITPAEVELVRDPMIANGMLLRIVGSSDQIKFDRSLMERITFLSDGTIWDANFIKAMSLLPTEVDDDIGGYATDDYISGLGGNDFLGGVEGNDTLVGGAGNDDLRGGKGSDTYVFSRGDGQDTILNWYFETGTFVPKIDALQFTSDISPADVIVSKSGSNLLLSIAGTTDQVLIQSYFPTSSRDTMEEIRFTDGTVWNAATIQGMLIGPTINGTTGADTLHGTEISEAINALAGQDTVFAGAGNDTIDGGLGADQLNGEDGDDVLMAGTGEANNATVSNTLRGGAGNDVLVSSGKTDFLYGDAGDDILLGSVARDWLEDTGGNNLLSGGATIDDVNMGDQNDLVIGGTGDDLLDGDRDADGVRGQDILSFNKSDGKDSVSRLGAGSTISIGGGTTYSNLSFEVVGNTLRLKTASSHYIALNDWFASSANRTVSTLQIVIEGTSNYNASSSNPMNNQKIQVFDFLGLVAAYDAAGRPNNFSIANNLANFRLWGSDTDAFGGAVAYQYATTGSISALTYDEMRAVISAPEFGVSAQPISASGMMSASSDSAESQETVTLSAMQMAEPGAQEATADTAAEGEQAGNAFAPDTPGPLRTADPVPSELLSAPLPFHMPAVPQATRGSTISAHSVLSFAAPPAQQRGNTEAPGLDVSDAAGTLAIQAQHTGDAVRRAAGSLAESDHSQEPSSDDIVALLSDRLNRAPQFHFEAFAEFLEAEANSKNAVLTSAQIAARWGRVRSYTETLGVSAAAEDLGAAGPFSGPYGLGTNGLGGESWSVPVRAAVGLSDSAAANLKPLEGIKGAIRTLA